MTGQGTARHRHRRGQDRTASRRSTHSTSLTSIYVTSIRACLSQPRGPVCCQLPPLPFALSVCLHTHSAPTTPTCQPHALSSWMRITDCPSGCCWLLQKQPASNTSTAMRLADDSRQGAGAGGGQDTSGQRKLQHGMQDLQPAVTTEANHRSSSASGLSPMC